jgi:hypothetical protein
VVKNYVPLVFSAANPLSAVKALLHVTSGHEEPIVDAAIDVVPVIVGAGVSSLSPAAAEKLLSDALRGGNAGTLRGINRFGGVVSSTGNTAGGVVVTAEGSVQGVDFAGHVNAGLMRGGPVNILSGVHGSEAGIMTADAAIFAEDVAMFGRMEGVTIHDTASLSAAEVGGMLNGPGTTIGAFCNSGACLAPFSKNDVLCRSNSILARSPNDRSLKERWMARRTSSVPTGAAVFPTARRGLGVLWDSGRTNEGTARLYALRAAEQRVREARNETAPRLRRDSRLRCERRSIRRTELESTITFCNTTIAHPPSFFARSRTAHDREVVNTPSDCSAMGLPGGRTSLS